MYDPFANVPVSVACVVACLSRLCRIVRQERTDRASALTIGGREVNDLRRRAGDRTSDGRERASDVTQRLLHCSACLSH